MLTSRDVAPLPAPALHRDSPKAERGGECETEYLAPFEGPLAWRTAYRGNGNDFHACPGWSRFGPVRPRGKWHKGIDIAAPTGTPVRAAVPGVLRYGRDPQGWGLYARLRFVPTRRASGGTCEAIGPMEIIYAHLLEDIPAEVVRAEVNIEAGAVVGRVGCSGNARRMCSPSPESHVHVTLRRGDGDREKVDPLPVVRWTLVEPPPQAWSPPLLACPIEVDPTVLPSR